jgi:RNA polymerase sigma-70 factor, ECF subfamily
MKPQEDEPTPKHPEPQGAAARIPPSWRPPAPPGTAEAPLGDEDRTALMHRALRALPKSQRLMILLYHFAGCSYEDVEELLGLSEGTVKSRLNRARLALRDKMEHYREC